MSTVGESIRAALIADAQVSALVSSRVYPNELPQSCAQPAIVYTVVSDVPENSLTGHTSTTAKEARVQIDCFARVSAGSPGAYAQVHTLAEAVEAAIGNLSGPTLSITLDSARDLYDSATQYFRVSMDFMVWH